MKSSIIFSILFVVAASHPLLDEQKFIDLEPIISESVDTKASFISCELCFNVINTIRYVQGLGLGYGDVSELIIDVCENALNATGFRGDVMCPGIANSYIKGLFDVVQKSDIDSQEGCLLFNFCTPDDIDPENITRVATEKVSIENIPKIEKKPTSKNTIKLVHLTDVHMDHKYTTGTNSEDCGYFVCCRPNYDGSGSARRFGEYTCNTPKRTVDFLLEEVKNLNPDMVIYTGDNAPHSLWEETQEIQLNYTFYLGNMMTETLRGFAFYPTIGNHETYPANFYDPTNEKVQEVNKAFASSFRELAGWNDEDIRNIERAGYYSTMRRAGLRIIGYNSNFGYNMNWYNALNKDQEYWKDMQKFVRDNLQEAKNNNEKVIMVGHHPTGIDTCKYYSDWYSNIIVEFSDIVVLQVFGHTHRDHFRLVNNANNQSVAIQYVSSSVTPRANRNPAVRVYELDASTYEVQNYENYILDLKTQPSDGKPVLKMNYNAKDEYNLPDLSAASWQQLAKKFESDDELFQKWYRHQFSDSDLQGECDADCKHEQICEMTNSEYFAANKCSDDF